MNERGCPDVIRLIGLPEPLLQLAGSAAPSAFPGVPLVRHADPGHVPAAFFRGRELWIAGPAAAPGVAALGQSGDGRHWDFPAVLLAAPGPVADGVRALDFSGFAAEPLAELLRGVYNEYDLRRENARLRGDLRTVATRIVHDLRSPLTPIFANCELLQIILAEAKVHEEDILQGLNNSAEDLSALVDRLSLIGKVTALPRSLEPVALGEVVFNARQKLEGRLLRAGAVIAEPAPWPRVRGVASWLEQVVVQWLENALRHGGTPLRLALGAEPAGDQVRLWIRDHGPGVPPGKAARLFQPFDTLHELGATRGLGLPLVQRIAEVHGGTAGYRPAAGGGAEFFVTLPAAP